MEKYKKRWRIKKKKNIAAKIAHRKMHRLHALIEKKNIYLF